MIKIQKTGKDGKIYDYWQLTEEDKVKMQIKREQREAEMLMRKKRSY